MGRPVLYIDIVGTLLLERGSDFEFAPFARSFVDGVRQGFDIRLLTTLEEHQALRVTRALGFEATYVTWRRALGKTTAIRFDETFFWVDAGVADDKNSRDLMRLSDERCSERLIPVNPRDGVTEVTLKKLLATLQEVQAAGEAGGGAGGGRK